MAIEIEEFDHLNHSPAFALAAYGWAENIRGGFGSHEATLHWSHKTIAARLDGVVAGVLVWDKIEHSREAWITLGYVDPNYRRRGVYSALYRRLVEIARREKLRSIAGGVAVGNDVMCSVAERQGRVATVVTYSQEVLPMIVDSD